MATSNCKKKPNYFKYKSVSKKPKLDLNHKGFLCTCNGHEKDCIRETYNLLNKYLEKLNPVDKSTEIQDKCDIEASLEQELANLKEPSNTKRFQAIDSGARNIMFIRTDFNLDPVDLCIKIIEDIHATKQQQSKYLLRLTPVETVCQATINDITKAFEVLAEKHFRSEPKTFAIVVNCRNNDHFKTIKDKVIESVAGVVTTTRDDHKVNLKGANVTILIDVIKTFAFLACVPNYIKYKKYNLLSVYQQSNESTK